LIAIRYSNCWPPSKEPSLLSLLPAFFFGGCTVGYVVAAKRLWGDPQHGSPVKREGTFNILGEYDQLWDGCVAALRRMKVEIKTIDAKKGVIEGETAWSWKSFGEILVVQITKAAPTNTRFTSRATASS
jgi:hypothetical protein